MVTNINQQGLRMGMRPRVSTVAPRPTAAPFAVHEGIGVSAFRVQPALVTVDVPDVRLWSPPV